MAAHAPANGWPGTGRNPAAARPGERSKQLLATGHRLPLLPYLVSPAHHQPYKGIDRRVHREKAREHRTQQHRRTADKRVGIELDADFSAAAIAAPRIATHVRRDVTRRDAPDAANLVLLARPVRGEQAQHLL